MDPQLFERLHREGLISRESVNKVNMLARNKLFSLHVELKTILYLGVLLLSSGLGIIIYKNIDTIGHLTILIVIGLLCIGCFFYCLKKRAPFSNQKIAAPNLFFDYVLLLGCLLLISFITYLQAEYHVFGSRYGLATFIPLVVLFFSAYFFDHLGILSLAIVNLAAWMGFVVTPLDILTKNDFSSTRLIVSGCGLGVLLLTAATITRIKNFKAHFEFTYENFGLNILLISGLAALFTFHKIYLLLLLPYLLVAGILYWEAKRMRSFYFLVLIVLYAYVAISYCIVMLLSLVHHFDIIYLILLYFIISGIALVRFLMHLNNNLKNHDSL